MLRKRGASPRQPLDSVRKKTILYHESVNDASQFGTILDGITLKSYPTNRTLAATME